MTANQMADEFEVIFDKITNNDSPGYEDTEISVFLNRGLDEFVDDTYTGTNLTKESFEETEKRRKDLSELTSNAEITTPSTSQTGNLPNGTIYDMPSDFLYAIKEEATISSEDECVDGRRILVKPVSHDYYGNNIDNPFKKPFDELVWRVDYSRTTAGTGNKRHELITDGSYDITTYHVRYLKNPTAIVVNRTTPASMVNCILDQSTHRRIIDRAVKIALEVTADPRLQTNVAISKANN